MLTLRHILSLVVISVVYCNLDNVTEKLNTTGSFSLKAEKTKALEKFIEILPNHDLRTLNGKVQNKTSTRSKQEILSPEYDWELGDKDNDDNDFQTNDKDGMKDWILCQKVKWEPTKELCQYCVVCNNVITVKTGFSVERNETFVIGVDVNDNDNDSDEDYDYLNLNINKKRRVIKSQFRPRPKPRPRPRPIRKGHKKDPEFKKAISTPFELVSDNTDIENNQKKREKQTMAILKDAFHEKRISLKEYLTILNNLVVSDNSRLPII